MAKLLLALIFCLPVFAQSNGHADRYLPNGMRVILVEDHHAPVASYTLLYNFGSADDPPGQTGLAHFCEHLMLTRSGETAAQYASLVERSGGSFNATTGRDSTRFYATVPAPELLQVLRYEAKRMSSRNFTTEGFRLEYTVVDNERIQHHDDKPYGAAEDYLDELAASDAAYEHPVIGYPQDLKRITLEDAKQFIARHYVPQNAVLAVVGDFSAVKLLDSIQQLFGAETALNGSDKEYSVQPHPHPHTGDYETTDSHARAARLYLAYPMPRAGSNAASALLLLDIILIKSHNAALKHALIDSGLATSVESEMESRKDGGLFYLVVDLANQESAGAVRAAIASTLQNLAHRVLPPEELRRAKLILETQQAVENESSRYRTAKIATGAAFFGDSNLIETISEQVNHTTSAEVASVAASLLNNHHVSLLVKSVSK